MGDRFCLVEAVNVNKAFLVKCKMGTFDQNAFGRQILEKKDFTTCARKLDFSVQMQMESILSSILIDET